jgi:hypothetical protein
MSGIKEAIAILGAPLGITILLILRLFGTTLPIKKAGKG